METVQVLLKNGAHSDINSKDVNGNTPLDLVLKSHYPDKTSIAQLLRSYTSEGVVYDLHVSYSDESHRGQRPGPRLIFLSEL
jgi:hypothetical protein